MQPNGSVQPNVEAVGKAILAQGKATLYREQIGLLPTDLLSEVAGMAPPLFLVRREKLAVDGKVVTATVVPARPLPTAAEATALIEGVK